ncbi:MAG: iron ABC transporter permease, partial [Gammaproteobacteria bacterium]|nr:iron ABC transporter permease [Gammaproteobacteria bacterium]
MRNTGLDRSIVMWLAMGWLGFAGLPWYAIEDGFWSLAWLGDFFSDRDYAPAVLQALAYDKPWLLPIALALMAPLAVWRRSRTDPLYAGVLIASGVFGLAYSMAQGFAIGIGGWE